VHHRVDLVHCSLVLLALQPCRIYRCLVRCCTSSVMSSKSSTVVTGWHLAVRCSLAPCIGLQPPMNSVHALFGGVSYPTLDISGAAQQPLFSCFLHVSSFGLLLPCAFGILATLVGLRHVPCILMNKLSLNGHVVHQTLKSILMVCRVHFPYNYMNS
jgi:hypothetical protein